MPTAEEVLAQQATEYQNAPRRPRWQPDEDGDYTEVIEDVQAAIVKDNPCIFIIGQVVDGEFEGRKNSIGYFGPKNWSMLADQVELLGGDPREIDDPKKALDFLKTKIGTPVCVRVATSGQYRNANIVGVVEAA